jgi:predicted RNase H-like HicB family nuclease
MLTTTQPTRFNVIVQKDDTWYVAKCIDNSVASQGRTVEEALDNLKEALELYYEDETLYDFPVPALLTSMEVAV